MSENNEQMIPTPSDFGHFLLEKELGHGGMGGVYLARDKMLDRKVGIKVMLKSLGDDPVFLERFQREAQAAARLNHPNIAQVYSFGTEQGMPYIAMELVSGGSLDKEMEANPGMMDPARVMRIGQQMAEALAVAAEQGLVHGDVKPENVLFDGEGNAKLVDFGLAAMQGDSDEIWGTPYYISPEKVKRQKIDFRADIYSLGGTLYHALTGVAPFEGEDATAVVKARFDGPPTPPSEVRPDLPKDVDAIIMRMLEMEPSMRYPTYQSLVGDIKRFLAKVGPVRTSRLATSKVKIKGTKMKLKTTASEEEGGDGGAGAGPSRLRPLVQEEPKKTTNVGAMVGLVVFVVIAAIVATVGGLIWYVKADKESKRKAEMAQTVGKIAEARQAIANTAKAAGDFGANFHELVARNDRVMNEASRRMQAELPSDLRPAAASLLNPPPTKDVLDAIAYTNKLLSADAAQPEAKKAEEKKPEAKQPEAKAEAEKKPAPEKKKAARVLSGEEAEEAAAERALAEQEARVLGKPLPEKEKKAEEAPAEEKPVAAPAAAAVVAAAAAQTSIPMPDAVKKFGEMWSNVFICRAADIRVQGHVAKIQAMAAKANDYKGDDFATAQALARLSQEVLDAFESMKTMKCVDDAQRKAAIVRQTAQSLVNTAVLQIQNARAKAEAAAAKAKEEAERQRKLEEARARQEKAREEEPQRAEEKFAELASSRLKTLDWDPALNQLRPLKDGFISPEGREAVDSQVKKVECMKALQDHIVKFGKGFKFKDGTEVLAVDGKTLTFQRMKSERGRMEKGKVEKVEWVRFYGRAEYMPYLGQFIAALVVKGRETTKIGPKLWSELMLGSALTLTNLFGEDDSAKKAAESYVKKAAKDFSDSAKWAKKWFPDVEIVEGE